MKNIKLDIVVDYLYDYVINIFTNDIIIKSHYNHYNQFRFSLSTDVFLNVVNGGFYIKFVVTKSNVKYSYWICFTNRKRFKSLKKIFKRAKYLQKQDEIYQENQELLSIIPTNYKRKEKLKEIL